MARDPIRVGVVVVGVGFSLAAFAPTLNAGDRGKYSAIFANGVLTVVKFGAFAVSGSAALLSEGIHSLADCSNQSLLALGLKKSERPADEGHPYGYSSELFIWALISAVGIFFLGCGLSVYHGVQAMMHPHPLENSTLSIGVLLFSAAVEAIPLVPGVQAASAAMLPRAANCRRLTDQSWRLADSIRFRSSRSHIGSSPAVSFSSKSLSCRQRA